MDKAMFYEVIVPLLGMNHTSLLAISTPSNEYNYFTTQMKLVDKQGKLLYKTIKIGQKCEVCEKANTADCPHRKFFMPPWKSNLANKERCEIILSGDPELANRELNGMMSSKTRFLFQDYLVDFKALPRYEFHNPVPVFHTSIDPSGMKTVYSYIKKERNSYFCVCVCVF